MLAWASVSSTSGMLCRWTAGSAGRADTLADHGIVGWLDVGWLDGGWRDGGWRGGALLGEQTCGHEKQTVIEKMLN